MARDLTSGMQVQARAEVVRPVALVEFEFDGGTLRLWTGVGEKSWAGDTYTGSGLLLQMSPITETSRIRANGMSFRLSGIGDALLSDALAENYQQRPCRVHLAFLDQDGAIVADPFTLFEGRMDVIVINEDPAEPTIELAAENRLIDLERARVRRWTDEDQRQLFAGDRFFRYVPALQNKELVWTEKD